MQQVVCLGPKSAKMVDSFLKILLNTIEGLRTILFRIFKQLEVARTAMFTFG